MTLLIFSGRWPAISLPWNKFLRIIATVCLWCPLFAPLWPLSDSPISGVHLSIEAWYPLLKHSYWNSTTSFSKTMGSAGLNISLAINIFIIRKGLRISFLEKAEAKLWGHLCWPQCWRGSFFRGIHFVWQHSGNKWEVD